MFELLEELFCTHCAVSTKTAVPKERIYSSLEKLHLFKTKGYVIELYNGRIYLTKEGIQALLTYFS